MHPRRPQPSTQFSAPICRPRPSAQPRSLLTSGFFSSPISSCPLAPTPSAAVHAVLRTHWPSAARAAKSLITSNVYSPPISSHSVAPRRPQQSAQFSAPIFLVRRRPRSHARSSPAASFPPPTSSHAVALAPSTTVRAILRTHVPSAQPRSPICSGFFSHPFPATPLHSRHPQPSAQFSAPMCRPRSQGRPSPAASAPNPYPALRCTHAVHAVLRTLLPSAQPSRSSPAASSPHPFLATLLHPRRPQPSAQISAPICRPQPSAQPRSLITSGFFPHKFQATPLHPRRPQPSTQFSAPVCHPQPSAQPRSLLTSGFFSSPISSHSVATRRPQPSAQFSAPIFPVRRRPRSHVRSSPGASSFHPFPATPLHSRHPQPFALFSAPMCRPRSQGRPSPAASSPHPYPATPLHPRRPRSSPPICRPRPSAQPSRSSPATSSSNPFLAILLHQRLPQPSAQISAPICRQQPSAQPRSLIASGFFPTNLKQRRCTHAVRSRPRSSPHPFAIRSRPRSQGRSSPAASSLHPFPAAPLHPRRPQPSAQFSAPIFTVHSRPRSHARSLPAASFPPPISSHAVALAPSKTVRAVLRTHVPSAQPRSPICSGFFSHPFPATPLHSRHPQPSAQFSAPMCRPRSQGRPSPAASSPHPYPALRCTHAVHAVLRTHLASAQPSRSSPAASSPHPFLATLLHPRRPQPSAKISAPICRPQPSAQPRSLITSGFFPPQISSNSVAPTPSAAVHAVLRTHLPSAAVRAAKVAPHQWLLLFTHFQLPPCTHAVRSRPRSSPHPLAVSRPCSQVAHHQQRLFSTHFQPLRCTTPSAAVCAVLRTNFPRPPPSAQPCSLITSGFFPPTHFQPRRCTRAIHNRPRNSAHPCAVRAAKVAHLQRLLLPPISSHAVALAPSTTVRAVLRTHVPSAQPRSPITSGFFSPPISSTPLHPRRPRSSSHPFGVRAAKSLITSGFFSPPIPSHPLAPAPSTAVREDLRTHLPFAAVRAAKVAHHQRLLPPTNFKQLRCTHAVRSRPRSSPHPFAVRGRPRSQGRSSPVASSLHPFPAAPLHPRRPQPSTQFSAPIGRQPPVQPSRSSPATSILHPFPATPLHHAVRSSLRSSPHQFSSSAAVRAAMLAHHQRLLSPTHFQPRRCTRAIHNRPRNSAHPCAVRAAKVAHLQRLLLPTHFEPLRCTHAVRSRPRSSPHPLAVSRPRSQVAHHQQLLFSLHFQPLCCTTPSAAVRAVLRTNFPRPPPSAQPRSLITSGFSPHPFPATPLYSRHPQPSAQFCAPMCRPRSQGRSSPAASSPHPFRATPLHPRRPQPSTPRSSPHPFAVSSRPRSQGRSSPAASSPHKFQATPLHPRRPQPSTQFSAPICRPRPSAQPRSLLTSGFFSSPISSCPLAPTPSAAVHAVLRTHWPSAARAAKSLITSNVYSPPISSHSVAPRRPQQSAQFSAPIFLVRRRPRSHARSSPAASFPHPFPATPLHSRHPQPSAQFCAPMCRPRSQGRPSAAASSPYPLRATPLHARRTQSSAQFSAPIGRQPSAQPSRSSPATSILPPFPATLLHHAVRSRPRSSPHQFSRPPPSAQPRSLITSGFSPHPFPATPLYSRHPQPSAQFCAPMCRPRSQGRSSPAASSPHPFRATPLHPRRPQPSAQFSAPIGRQPSAQPRSLITSGFFSPSISSHSVAPTPSAAVHTTRFSVPIGRQPPAQSRLLITSGFFIHPIPSHPLHPRRPQPSTQFSAPIGRQPPVQPSRSSPATSILHPFPATPLHHAVRSSLRSSPHQFSSSAAIRAAMLAHHQRLLSPTHFQPRRCTRAIHNRPPNSAHPCAVRAAKVAHLQRLLLPTHFEPLRCTTPSAAVRAVLRTNFPRPPPSSQPRSLITSGFFSPSISSHSVAPTPSAAVHATQFSAPIYRPRPSAQPSRSSPAASSPHPFPATPLHPRRPQPSAQFSAPIFPVRRRPRSHARSSPAASFPHPFQATPLYSRHPQPSAQFCAPMCRPRSQARSSPAASSSHPFPATPLHSRRPRSSPHPFSVSCPRSQGRSSPAASSPHPFRATPLHPRRPQPSTPRSSPHPFTVRGCLRSQVAHHQRLLLPTHFQPLPCTHAVRSRPHSSPHPLAVSRPRSRPRSQGRSSPAASSPHPFPATPFYPRRPQPSTPRGSLYPLAGSRPRSQGCSSPAASSSTPFLATPCTHAVRSRPRSSPHPFSRSRPRSQGRSSPAASSPHKFQPTPLHPRRPQPSTQFFLRTHLPSAAVHAAKVAPHQRLLP